MELCREPSAGGLGARPFENVLALPLSLNDRITTWPPEDLNGCREVQVRTLIREVEDSSWLRILEQIGVIFQLGQYSRETQGFGMQDLARV